MPSYPLLPPDFHAFRTRFDAALATASKRAKIKLGEKGATAFAAFLKSSEVPDAHLLRWFVGHYRSGAILPSEEIETALHRLEVVARRATERLRQADLTAVMQTRRTVQLSWFGFAGFKSTDAFEVRQSIFRSPQEREFCAAVSLRFPGLSVLPNYPMRCFLDLEKLAYALPSEVIHYGSRCDVDFLIATPREGDAVAVFELDSRLHDEPHRQERDAWRESLLRTARVPLYRLRTDNPTATSVDEWYAILTDQVAPKIDCGERIRSREVRTTLVPIFR